MRKGQKCPLTSSDGDKMYTFCQGKKCNIWTLEATINLDFGDKLDWSWPKVCVFLRFWLKCEFICWNLYFSSLWSKMSPIFVKKNNTYIWAFAQTPLTPLILGHLNRWRRTNILNLGSTGPEQCFKLSMS